MPKRSCSAQIQPNSKLRRHAEVLWCFKTLRMIRSCQRSSYSVPCIARGDSDQLRQTFPLSVASPNPIEGLVRIALQLPSEISGLLFKSWVHVDSNPGGTATTDPFKPFKPLKPSDCCFMGSWPSGEAYKANTNPRFLCPMTSTLEAYWSTAASLWSSLILYRTASANWRG